MPIAEMTWQAYAEHYFSTYQPPISLVYLEEVFPALLPVTNNPKVNWKFSQQQHLVSAAAGVINLHQASVAGANGAVITREGVLLKDVSRQFGSRHQHPLYSRYRSRERSKLAGKTAVLTTAGANTYFHWMVDIIPRFHLLQRAGMANDVDHFIVPPLEYDFQKQALALAGIDITKCKSISENQQYETDYLFVPTLPSLLGMVSPWVSRYLNSWSDTSKGSSGTRLYVGRKGHSRRGFTNEAAIQELVKGYGFQVFYPEDHSLAEQINIYQGSQVVVAPHGSGLANTVFCRKGTQVVDMMPANFVVPVFFSIARALDLNYHYLADNVSLADQYQYYWENNDESMTFPLNLLDQTLQKIINS